MAKGEKKVHRVTVTLEFEEPTTRTIAVREAKGWMIGERWPQGCEPLEVLETSNRMTVINVSSLPLKPGKQNGGIHPAVAWTIALRYEHPNKGRGGGVYTVSGRNASDAVTAAGAELEKQTGVSPYHVTEAKVLRGGEDDR